MIVRPVEFSFGSSDGVAGCPGGGVKLEDDDEVLGGGSWEGRELSSELPVAGEYG